MGDKCFVSKDILEGNKLDIRKNVCKTLTVSNVKDDRSYCVLHLPERDKISTTNFISVVNGRIHAKQNDFRYIYVPDSSVFFDTNFKGDADFSYAVFDCPIEDFGKCEFDHKISFANANFKENVKFIKKKFKKEVDFNRAKFDKKVNFNDTVFEMPTNFRSSSFLYKGDFKRAKFNDIDFTHAVFTGEADFYKAKFQANAVFYKTAFTLKADFTEAVFTDGAYFKTANFEKTSRIYFHRTKFNGIADFSNSNLEGYVLFEGNKTEHVFLDNLAENQQAVLNLQTARLEKPERISFQRVRLCPNWFVNIDSRKMVFTDVNWENLELKRDYSNINEELESLNKRGIPEPSRLLEIACRQLAVNAEENNRYEEASKFRFMAMETKRLEYAWKGRFWTINWWYKFSSDYGENWKRAFIILLVLLFLVFPVSFALTDFQVCPNDKPISESLKTDKESAHCQNNDKECGCRKRGLKITDGEAFIHSLATATFQNIEYRKPVTFWTDFWIILEKILVPLQAALLALAIRRKFMR